MLPTLSKPFVSIADLSMFLKIISVKVSHRYSPAGSQKYTQGPISTTKEKTHSRLAPPSELWALLHHHHSWHLLSHSHTPWCTPVYAPLVLCIFNTPSTGALALLRPHLSLYCLWIAHTVFSYFIQQRDFISLSVCLEKIHSAHLALTCIFAQQ